MRQIARGFGVGSAVALVLVIATGAVMASHLQLWNSEEPRHHYSIAAGSWSSSGSGSS
jgi:hypothetical protein